jgi:hypothetical protein
MNYINKFSLLDKVIVITGGSGLLKKLINTGLFLGQKKYPNLMDGAKLQ